jgi:hypothetical protein
VYIEIVVVVRDDLKPWQELNVAAFLVSGVAAARPDLVGEPYRDASGTAYLAMFGQPVMVLAASADVLSAMRDRAHARKIPAAVFTDELFVTGNDVDNRAAVRAVATEELSLAGLAVAGPRAAIDKVTKGALLHS